MKSLTLLSISSSTSPSLFRELGSRAVIKSIISCIRSAVAFTKDPLTSSMKGRPLPSRRMFCVSAHADSGSHLGAAVAEVTTKIYTKTAPEGQPVLLLLSPHLTPSHSPKQRTSMSSRPHGWNLQVAPRRVFITASVTISSTLQYRRRRSRGVSHAVNMSRNAHQAHSLQ